MQGATAALMSTIFSDGFGLKNVTSKMSNQELAIRLKVIQQLNQPWHY